MGKWIITRGERHAPAFWAGGACWTENRGDALELTNTLELERGLKLARKSCSATDKIRHELA